jgi:NADPH-dependent glutamate synthase beta subunit-like oxidoreductase/NAD(P)H-flavin reductase
MGSAQAFGFGFTLAQLYAREGLVALDQCFVAQLDAALHNRLAEARLDPSALDDKAHSQLLMDLATPVEDFIAELFGIRAPLAELAARHQALAPVYACKRLFVQRRAAKAFKEDEAAAYDGEALRAALALEDGDFELAFARRVMTWLDDEAAHKPMLEIATRYAAWALYNAEGKRRHAQGVLFKLPKKLDAEQLVAVETELRDGVTVLKIPASHRRHRAGFALTDAGGTLTQALDQAHYCIYCHHQGRDSCSTGLKEKDGNFRVNALGVTLGGCPLEEKISEMNELKAAGVPLGALAMVVVDNPMCAGTGHRICNDCMKSCIYQKQEPVNIPLVETRTLADILALPYGFEVYSLLTRWNPLNLARPLPRPETGKKVLVAGLGPAGYTLAHHLLNDGHTVVGIDGLKIEPLPERFSSLTAIRDVEELREKLDERVLAGFGGVAEYGITVRWDKNYLKIIRLLLERRAQFAMFGGVRFGSTITYDSAFAMGFDHIALCLGAGRPTLLEIPGGLARGVRTASDFLMSLQLTGAAKANSIANLQVRLPVVVIGGGLTAIDTATEALAYYPVQVEKFLARYEALARELGEARVRAGWTEEETEIAEEFLGHARALRGADSPARAALLEAWGGVKLVYRKRLIDAPSYRLNHEEVEKALEEGIFFAELWEPARVDVDECGHAKGIWLQVAGYRLQVGSDAPATTFLPARTVLVAAGTNPNTVLQREDPLHFALDGRYFRAVDEEGRAVTPERFSKPSEPRVLLAVEADGRAVSFFGDLHPSFAGNVVKAMGSAKQGYPVVSRMLERSGWRLAVGGLQFLEEMREKLTARVHAVNRLTPNIVEVVIHAPLAAERFEPGQFYRLQNYEANALSTANCQLPTTLAMEGLAMTGAWVDKARGLVSVIALEMGGSSDLCAHLAPGEAVVLMGPTGTPTEIPAGETVLLAGGGLGNAVLFSIGRALRAKGSKVLYFAGYKTIADRYKVEEIEAAADVVVWCCDEAPGFVPTRPQDYAFVGNIVEGMRAYGARNMPEAGSPIPLASVQRIVAIGSDRMMAAVARARHDALKEYLPNARVAVGSINSPMQCMMKEICAQCLQEHRDPATGKISYVYSCFNQDQDLDLVAFPHLNERLKQNSLQEKLTKLWVDSCLKQLNLREKIA